MKHRIEDLSIRFWSPLGPPIDECHTQRGSRLPHKSRMFSIDPVRCFLTMAGAFIERWASNTDIGRQFARHESTRSPTLVFTTLRPAPIEQWTLARPSFRHHHRGRVLCQTPIKIFNTFMKSAILRFHSDCSDFIHGDLRPWPRPGI